MTRQQPTPVGLGRRGRAIWRVVIGALVLDAHEGAILAEACRTADRLDALDAAIRKDGMLLPDRRPHPALAEARQQQITLTRLIASLRLPADLAQPERRPQRRGAARGVYHDRGLRVVGGES